MTTLKRPYGGYPLGQEGWVSVVFLKLLESQSAMDSLGRLRAGQPLQYQSNPTLCLKPGSGLMIATTG